MQRIMLTPSTSKTSHGEDLDIETVEARLGTIEEQWSSNYAESKPLEKAFLRRSSDLGARAQHGAKRAVDMVLSAGALTLLAPALAFLWIAIRLTSPGSVFYNQKRVGAGGVPIRVWKFRSMRQDADAVLAEHLATDPALKEEWDLVQKLRNDPRVTPIGKLLRKTSMDELPQLWNVLRGEMSLVGPRPIVDVEIERYSSSFEFYKRVRPGITGLWQISGRNNTTYSERVMYDVQYVANWSLWLDLKILIRTVKTVLTAEGAS